MSLFLRLSKPWMIWMKLIFGKVVSVVIVFIIIFIAFAPMPVEGRLKSNWSRNYGGEFHDVAHEVLLSEDGGYLLAGYSSSFGAGNRDQVYLVKTNTNGYTEWRKDIGGEYSDKGFAATNTDDGGYAIAGLTTSYGGRDNYDFYFVKTDSEGNVEWESNFGGDHNEIAYDVIQTSDGGYLLGGTTVTYGNKGTDWWVVKTNETGEKEWSRYYGGEQDEELKSVMETEDGNFVLGGSTASFADPGFGLWALEIDEGNIDEEKEEDVETDFEGVELEKDAIRWETNVGGFLDDKIHDMIITQDGGFAATGKTESYTDTGSDFWLVKLDSEGQEKWNKSYGGDYFEVANAITETDEGNLMMAGYETSWGGVQEDFFVLETDENGEELSRLDVGGERTDIANSIITVDDDTFAVAGQTRSFGGGGFSFYLVEIGRPSEISVSLVLGAVGIGVVGIYAGVKLFKKYRYLFKFKRF